MNLELLDPSETGYYAKRRLPDGRLVAVVPLLFDRARLGIGDDTDFSELW